MTRGEMLVDRMRYVRDTCIDRRADPCGGGDLIAAVSDLSCNDGKLQAALRLVLLYLESPPEEWRGEVSP
jgi:hypothetical protein